MPRAKDKHPLSKTPPKTELAAKLQDAMREREMTIDDLQNVIFKTEAHTRLLYRGISPPGIKTLGIIVRYFGWDWEETLELLTRAKQAK